MRPFDVRRGVRPGSEGPPRWRLGGCDGNLDDQARIRPWGGRLLPGSDLGGPAPVATGPRSRRVDATPTDLFLRDCGVDGPVGLDVEDVNRGERAHLSFPQPFAVIGRDPASHFRLDHWQVSRRHLYLQWIGGRPFAVDLESRTGTGWGPDAAPKEQGWLGPGREIRIGPLRIQADDAAPAGPADPLPTRRCRGTPAGPGLVLESPHEEGRWSSWRMDRVLALAGRSPRCKVRLARDEEVSRFHCALLRLPTGLWVVDLLSRDGTHVQGTRVRFARVGDGDEIRLGRFVLRARYDTPPATPAGEALRQLAPWASPARDLAIPEGRRPAPAIAPAARPLTPLLIEDPGAAPLGPILDQIGQMQQQMLDQFHQAMLAMFQAFGTLQREQMAGIREELDQIRRLTEELKDARAEAVAVAPPTTEEAPAPGPIPADPGRPPEGPTTSAPQQRPEPRPDVAAAPGVDLHAELTRRIAQIQNDRQSRWQRLLEMVGRSGPNSG